MKFSKAFLYRKKALYENMRLYIGRDDHDINPDYTFRQHMHINYLIIKLQVTLTK